MTPKIAFMLAQVLSIALLVSAAIVTVLFSLIFPEYATDAVRGWMGGWGRAEGDSGRTGFQSCL
jgi:hypothetical protein